MSLVHIDTIREFISLARDTPPGCFVEVGVYQGGTAAHLNRLAVEQNRKLFLYDTFTGIPEKSPIDRHIVGDFSDTSIELARAAAPDAQIIVGIFPGTLIEMPPIAFAHIDCDQYASVKACCEVLGPRMVEGGVMWFDDYYCLDGATAAVNECFGARVCIAASEKAFVRF
jgi:O-methyltransferase